MVLEKYKVCPICGKHNAPSWFECRECETDLTGVKVVDGVTELKQSGPVVETPPKELVRICDCGEMNPPQARKCRACGEDISDILPTEYVEPETKQVSYKLETMDGSYSISIDSTVLVVGREAALNDYLSSKAFVSRQHAKLTIIAGKVFIENLSQTNKTFVNNKPIDDKKPFALKDGDEIGLGGKEIEGNRQNNAAYFYFRIQS